MRKYRECLPLETHWSPLELEIIDDDNNNLIKLLFTIGANLSLIVDDDDNNLTKELLAIGAHWSQLELENSYGIIIFLTAWCLPLEPTL